MVLLPYRKGGAVNKHDLWNDIARSVRGDAWHGRR